MSEQRDKFEEMASSFFEPVAAGNTVKVHPAADTLPLLDDAAARALQDDIAANGLRERIKLWSDHDRNTMWIVDGRNRTRAAIACGLKPADVLQWEHFDDDTEAARFVFSLNLERRHLNSSQRAMAASRLLPMFEQAARERQLASLKQGDKSPVPANLPERGREARDDAAAALNVSARSVGSAKKVLTDAPELAALVESGKLAVSAAARLSSSSPEIRERVIEGINEGLSVTDAIARGNPNGPRLVEPLTMTAPPAPHVSHNSGEVEWYTPPHIIEAARRAMCAIDVDPASCAKANETVRATTFYTAEDNGLFKEWPGKVWLNPPYGQPLLKQFCMGLIERRKSGEVEEACVLVNNITETEVGQALLRSSAAVCFPKGRLRFVSPSGPKHMPLQGQMILYMGDHPEDFEEAFREIGDVWTRNQRVA